MRRWHRWIGLGAVVFLLSVGITGVILQFQQFFGEDEATKEKLASLTSAYSVSSALGDFAPKLAKAEASVARQAGDAKLDNVELQLKGDHATFIFHTSGKANRKYIVNAATAAIEKSADDERESFLLRLHTGEVFGDGGVVLGMFWGTALLVLSVTGLYLYWQMYRARAKRHGWKKLFWAVALPVLIFRQSSRAGSPFLTDDPGFVDKGWEIHFASVYEKDKGQSALTAPIVDLNYTLVPGFKLDLTLGAKGVFPEGQGAGYGVADTDFKFKWRFLDEKPGAWWPAISMAPDIGLPTASRSRGLGNGTYGFRVPFQFGKTFDKLYIYTETGYQFVFSDKQGESIIWGFAAQYNLTDKWNVGAEIFNSIPVDKGSDYTSVANVGLVYTFDPHWQIQGTVGRTLRDVGRGGPEFSGQLVLVWNF